MGTWFIVTELPARPHQSEILTQRLSKQVKSWLILEICRSYYTNVTAILKIVHHSDSFEPSIQGPNVDKDTSSRLTISKNESLPLKLKRTTIHIYLNSVIGIIFTIKMQFESY
ncbi:hypothetical protein O181_101057 [Austropuccinia psidii MF-1]|uniref:Uncharacterized protein n=1 Tax=Austropuccinia psidii MF-1 TaxID=1389203 RepID=A0A9Q3JF84_9BASI|nr:hypothetical protein [Austropuccinia psidii MF-1]